MKHHYGACQGGPDCNCDDYDMDNNDSEPTTDDCKIASIDRAPAEIFLITGCDVDELAEVDWNEVTWCDHRAEKGIRYVREDLVSKPQDREPTE